MVKRRLQGLLANNSGAAAVIMALTLPVVVGGMGLGTEVGYWYFNQRKVQHSADMAAYAGAVELRSGKELSSIEAAATDAAEETGYAADKGAIVVNTPPTSGAFAGDANAVEVTVQENMSRLFTALFADGTVDVSGRAVARISGGQQTCVLSLDKSAAGAVTFIGSTSAILIGCNVHSNSLSDSSVLVSGSATVQTPCMSASGMVSISASLTLSDCVAPYEHADQVADPYADLPVPDLTGPWTTPNRFGGGSGASYDISPGRYDGMDISRTVNMAPGVYVIDGGELRINSTATVNGSGVTFYLTNGATVSMNGGADVQLSAPTSGSYAGVLVFVGRSEPYNDYTVNGNSGSTVNGAIYAANGNVRMNGTSTFGGGCTQIVARTIEFSGNAGLGVDCTGSGVRDIRSSRLVTIVE
jgi:Flp pilus assembly protein TadG